MQAKNMASKSPSLDPIYRWLRHVDEQISPGEIVEFLKLPLYPFLRIEYATAQKLKTPSKVYNFLLEKCFQCDKEKTLQWFAHALGLLSGDLRGTYLVGDNCLPHYGLSLPSTPDKMDAESRFFECLTRIARKARGYNLEEELKERFARKRFLNINPRLLKHLPDLFIRLVQSQIIGPTNTYHLLRALRKLGSTKATQCLVCLNKYHKIAGLDEIEEVKGIKKEPQTTVFENTDKDTSSDFSAAVSDRRLVKTSKSYYKYRQRAREYKVSREGKMDESLKTLDLSREEISESEPTSTSESETSSTATDPSDSITPQPTSRAHCKKTVLCCCWIVSIAVILTSVGVLYGVVWQNLFIQQKFDEIIVYNEAAFVITDLDQFYYSQLKLVPRPGIPLGDHVVEVYRFNSSCDQLPTNHSIIHWRKSNISDNQNYTHQYLLPRSTLNYSISSVNHTSVRVVDMATHTHDTVRLDGELESVKGYIYITHGPESIQDFDPRNCQGSSDCTIMYNKPFTHNLNDSYPVDSRGYYNFHTAHIVDPNYRYTLDLIINATTVDLSQAQPVCNITDINEGERSCSIPLQFNAGRVCFVAYTKYEDTSISAYSILDIEVTKWLLYVLLITVLPLVVFILILFVCLISCTIMFCCRKKTIQYARLTSSS